MPGSDDDPDKLQTFGPDNSGKSKTSQIAPEQVGRENARTDHKAGEVDANAVQTDSLLDRANGQPFETLRTAGFETGDYILLDSLTLSTRFNDVTSTTFTGVSLQDTGFALAPGPGPDPSKATYGVTLTAELFDNGNGNTVSTRLKFKDAKTTRAQISVTAPDFDMVSSGSPETLTDAEIATQQVGVEVKSSDGNPVDVSTPVLRLWVEL